MMKCQRENIALTTACDHQTIKIVQPVVVRKLQRGDIECLEDIISILLSIFLFDLTQTMRRVVAQELLVRVDKIAKCVPDYTRSVIARQYTDSNGHVSR